MRGRDERIDNAHHKAKGDALHDKTSVKTVKFFRPEDFKFNADKTATCPAGPDAHEQRQHLRPARASIPALRGTR
jgi:hypothetical protein